MLVVSKLNINKDNNTTWIRGNYCYNPYLSRYYKSKCACLFCAQFLTFNYTHFWFNSVTSLLCISAMFKQRIIQKSKSASVLNYTKINHYMTTLSQVLWNSVQISKPMKSVIVPNPIQFQLCPLIKKCLLFIKTPKPKTYQLYYKILHLLVTLALYQNLWKELYSNKSYTSLNINI